MEQLDIFSQQQTVDPLFAKLEGLKKLEHVTIQSSIGEITVQLNQFGKYQYQLNESDGVCKDLDEIYKVVKTYVNQIVLEEDEE